MTNDPMLPWKTAKKAVIFSVHPQQPHIIYLRAFTKYLREILCLTFKFLDFSPPAA